jgi:hypothetical protein
VAPEYLTLAPWNMTVGTSVHGVPVVQSEVEAATVVPDGSPPAVMVMVAVPAVDPEIRRTRKYAVAAEPLMSNVASSAI